MPVHNAEIAAMFNQAADLLDIEGANPFRVRAYRQAARVIEALPRSIASMVAEGEDLSRLRGIGKDLAGKLAVIVKAGKFDLLEQLKHELPGDVGAMTTLPGLGPKRVRLIVDELGIRTLKALKSAAQSGRLRTIRGFGPKMEQAILTALARDTGEKRYKLPFAEAEAEALVAWLRAGMKGGEIIVAGSYRRRRDTVGDLDILATGRSGAKIGERLAGYENVDRVLAQGATRVTVVLRSGLQVDLRVVPEQSYGAALLYFTGSKAHNIALRRIANDHRWKLNEYGLFAGTRRIAGATEAEVYKKLGLIYVPPELREDRGEIECARKRKLPKLIELQDLRGDLHAHTTWSDGTAAIEEMVAAARMRGLSYLAITDHSRRLTMAHGLDPKKLARQIGEIERLNAKLKNITVLKGTEVDILEDGTLDLPDSILSRLDVVVASIHSKFDLPQGRQTERLIRAMDNPLVSIIGHPTGRLIGEREPYDIDMERVIAAAAERGCHLEINSGPDRLDLNDVHAKAAKDSGVLLAISSDAHAPANLDWLRFGVDQARRGWIEAKDVINTRPLKELRKLLKR